MRHERLEPCFVEYVPDQLEPGTIYVSMEYGSASHLCCCGCGSKVVTPLTPTDWKLTFDGETVSFWPSIGNWEQPCRSHYVIKRGKVIDAGPLPQSEIDGSREADRKAKARYYGTAPQSPVPASVPSVPDRGFWATVANWLLGK